MFRDPLHSPVILTARQRLALRRQLEGKLLAVCFGAGVDSTAMMIAMRCAGIRPDVITFADTGGEKPETLEHLHRMNEIVQSWGWPEIAVCKKAVLKTTGYTDLFGNCIDNETLPSLAFGGASCSIKWKQTPQDQYLKGAKSGPNKRPPHELWLRAEQEGRRIVKLIGYDCGKADLRRTKKLKDTSGDFEFIYPLQTLGWTRIDCVQAIVDALGADMVPIKSACYFCPASRPWELYWLAAKHPELLENALRLERNALTGRHSRFDEVEFGDTWESLVSNADRFPSTSKCVGLGRAFAWNQWCRVNGVVDLEYKVIRSEASRFAFMADMLRRADNALDARSVESASRVIQVVQVA